MKEKDVILVPLTAPNYRTHGDYVGCSLVLSMSSNWWLHYLVNRIFSTLIIPTSHNSSL